MAEPALSIDVLRRSCAQCSLGQLCLPAGIGSGDVERLDRIVRRRRTMERDGRLFRVGDPLRAVYVAREGAFKTVGLSPDGAGQIFGFHLPGELIGLDALAAGEHRCEAVALLPSEVCEVPYEALADVAAQLPALQRQLLRVIGRSLGRDQDHATILARRQAHERIALFLHGLGERLRALGRSEREFKLPMSREDIADFLGLAFETVSRGFSRLQDEGIIAVHGRQVQVLDPAALLRLAHGDAA